MSSEIDAPSGGGLIRAVVRPFLTSHLSVLLLGSALLLGAAAVFMTPREEEPQIVVPFADVLINFPGASAKEVETLAARPLEKLLWQVDGVEYVYSMSRRGQAIVTVRFFVGQDRERSLVKLRNRIEMHQDAIPPGVVGWLIKPREVDDVPIVTVALHSLAHDAFDLRRIGEELLAGLEDLDDLSRTEVLGGQARKILVRPDPVRLSGYGISMLELMGTLRAADAALDTGSFSRHDVVHELAAGPFLSSVRDIEELVVGVHKGSPIFLKDVATVRDGPEEPTTYTRMCFGPGHKRFPGGKSRAAVSLAISKKKGTNAVTVAAKVLKRIEKLKEIVLPDGVEIEITRNSGKTANEKVDDLLSSLFFAVISVVVLISLTMGWREGLVVAAAVPVSFAGALFVNLISGYTINRVTLFALILSLGLVVDDPITNVDNIQRHLRMRKKDPLDATLDAVEEVLPPVLLSTLAIIISFLPMYFITGMMGPYMGPMAANVPLAVTFSTISALTFVPWLAYLLLRNCYSTDGSGECEAGDSAGIGEDPTPAWMIASARWVLRPFLRSRLYTIAFLGLLTLAWFWALSLPLTRAIPLKMLPFDNKDEFQLVLDMPEGTPLERTDAVARSFEMLLHGEPLVSKMVTYVGHASPIDFNGLVRHYDFRLGANLADIRVYLKSKLEREEQSHSTVLRLRHRLHVLAKKLGVRLKVVEVPPGPPVLAMIVAEVYGPPGLSYQDQIAGAEGLMERMEKEPGLVDLDVWSDTPRMRYDYVLDKEKAALHGVRTDSVVRTLGMAVGGQDVGLLHLPRERQPLHIEVRLDEPSRSGLEKLLALEVKGATGGLVALGELGEFRERPQDLTIYHKNLSRVVFVSAEAAGRPPGEAILDLQSSLAKTPLKQPVRVEWAGEGEWLITVRVFRDLGIAFAVAHIGIFLLLVFQTGSTSLPLLIMLAIPLTALGVMPGFWVLNMVLGGSAGGYPDLVFFTATAMIGMIALGGIVVRNSIVLIEFIEGATAEGMSLEDAVTDSVAVRLRPIVLTAMTTGIGAIPITLDPIFSGLAWALLFGLLASTLFTLVVIPVVFYYWKR
jgi:multidrug efflux pump subunit AcrB